MAADYQDASPTRPESHDRVSGPSALVTEPPTFIKELLEEVWEAEGESYQPWEEGQEGNSDDLASALRLQARIAPPPTKINASSLTAATSLTSGGSAAVTTGPTYIAVFTGNDGGIYTVTSASGMEVVDGKTIMSGAGVYVGEENVSEGKKGIVANGQTIAFTTFSTSSAGMVATTSSAQASKSASHNIQTAATTQQQPHGKPALSQASGAAPQQTAAGHMVAFVGAVVGAMVL